MADISSLDIALAAARAADERKAFDIMILDVRELVDVTDYFVIATGRNNPQVEAIVSNVEDELIDKLGVKPNHREGANDPGWKLIDYGDVVVDVFQPEVREYYRLESLWGDALVVDLAQAGIENPEYSDRIGQLVERHEEAAQ